MIGVPAYGTPRGNNEGLQGLRYARQPRRACRRFHHGGRIRRSCHHIQQLAASLIPVGATDFWDTKFGLFLTALVSFLVIAVVVYLVEESEVRLMSRADAIERLNLIWSQEA